MLEIQTMLFPLSVVLVIAVITILVSCSKSGKSEVVQGEMAKDSLVTAAVTGENFDRKQLIRIALENLHHSYAPYSNFNVAAAVLMSSGKIYYGVNVENASYGNAICAERTAITHAIKSGEKEIVAIAIVGGKNQTVTDYCAPCGICRQIMREFSDPKKMRVIIAKTEDDYKDYSLEELLPVSFGPANLE